MNNNRKAFTLIELIVTIAVLGILVLLAGPKLLGYVEKAELTKIQHDVKVMEQEMKIALIEDESNFSTWDYNAKDLGKLILSDKLYEKEGFAKNVDKTHLKNYFESKKPQQNGLGVGGESYPVSTFADEIPEGQPDILVSLGYKIIPEHYNDKIKTSLGGTFYTNPDGKVYYEHDKALSSQKDDSIEACNAPIAESLGYTFEIISGKGTITKYDHREQNIVIPSTFKIEVDGEEICEPVRVIGKGAFAYGPLKELVLDSVVIPDSVEIIEDEAFKDNNIKKIIIPSSVTTVGDNVFSGNGTETIIVRGNSNSSPINSSNSGGADIEYNYGTPGDLDIIFDYSSGTVIGSSGGGSWGSGGGSGGGFGGGSVSIPEYVTSSDGINYPIKNIAKGAYQGQGLISVILPEGLERIEDYAFSGNQLVGITIPNSVIYIGNYAFSFNEKTHSVSGDKFATIKTVIMKEIERFDKIDNFGNISEGGLKVNLLDGELTLLDHIFVTSIGKNVQIIDNEESEAGEPDIPQLPVDEQKGPIIFDGLGPEAYDGDDETYVSRIDSKSLTWNGDLDNKEIEFNYLINNRDDSIEIHFRDKDNVLLKSPNSSDNSIRLRYEDYNVNQKKKIIVPKGATIIRVISSNNSNRINEITVPEVLSIPQPQRVLSSSTRSDITLNWSEKQRAIIIKNGAKIGEVIGNTFVDKPLNPNSTHNYQILFLDEHGNGANDYIEISESTKNLDVVFNGLGPKAWDGDDKTYVNSIGSKSLTWNGDLDNKEIEFNYLINSRDESIEIHFRDKDNVLLKSPSSSDNSIRLRYEVYNVNQKKKIIVPKGATTITVNSSNNSNRINEISVPEVLSNPQPQRVLSSSTRSDITLNWAKKQRAIIIKNGAKIGEVIGNTFVDKPLHPNSTHNYQILFLDEHGNGANDYIEISESTKNLDVVFNGLGPKAWDGDDETYVNSIGSKSLTWNGDLDNKEIEFNYLINSRDEYILIYFRDKDNVLLKSPSSSDNSIRLRYEVYNVNQKKNVTVPKGATTITINSSNNSNRINEIAVLSN